MLPPLQSGKKRGRDSGLLAVGTEGGSIVVWQLNTGEALHCLEAATKATADKAASGHVGRVNDIVFDSTGAFLFSCGEDKQVLQWSMKTGELVR